MASSLPNAARRPENPRFRVHSDNPNAHTHGLPRPGLRVRAIYDFLPSEPGGLRILKGNIITVLEYSQPQWWKGFLEGRIGLFPTSYVEELSTPSQEDIGTNTGAPVIHVFSSSPTADCEPTNPGLSTAVSKAASDPHSRILTSNPEVAAPHPSQPGAPRDVYDGLSMFEEPLIDLDSSDESPAAPLAGQTWPGLDFSDPLIPPPNVEVEKAWDEAADINFNSDDFDFTNLHPDVRRRLSVEAKKYMPKPKSPSTDRHESSMKETVDISIYDEGDPCCRAARQAKKPTYFCSPCNFLFCDSCWGKEKAHRPHARDRNGPPHEKTDPTIAKTVECALQPNIRDEEQALLHLQDEDTSWFGAGRDELDEAVFQDYGRYANLMAERSARHRTLRYPALVSFVGQTGAGKSTLIRLLIELLSLDIQNPQVPVVGSVHNPDIPTSGDVHLYCDPRSSGSEHPILYADCEGLDGGAREPLGAKSRRKNRREGSGNEQKKRTTSFTKHIRRTHNTSEREILWATTEATRSREFYVRDLYPRLLYTFSDVIVFVTKNPKVIENVIEHLIRWSATALETSSNQPVLPHAIIVLNAADHGTDQNLWDVNKSTVALLNSVGRAVHQNHNFRKHAEFWRQKQKSIESIESLLSLYYSSIRVVRVPAKGRPKLISEQLHRLYNEISGAADRARASKHTLRMLLDSDELQPYLQYAFDHFCRDLDVPFDFVQASFAHNPIPSDFGGNILKLAININEVWRDKVDGPTIFKELSFIVASCIMLEQARHRTLGSAEQVFPEYLDHCDVALEDFCQRYWPCEYVGGRGRCVNVKAGHIKGHQLKSGQVLAVGNYCSSFSAESYRPTFRNDIYRMLAKLLEKLQNATQTTKYMETQEAANIHRDTVLRHFFHHLDGPKNFISHTACFSCLIAPPEHPLPCGHVLCTPCIRDFGSARGRTTIDMKYCPLHRKEDPDGQFDGRWPVIVKPPGAGIRVLSLDGGGIRGIVELITLQHIQTELGVRLPIQAFFDLIVGTSTGGIIALGLGAKGWPVEKCTRDFASMCKKAFKKRKGVGFPGIEFLVSATNHSRYETKPLESALKAAYGEENLFGGPKDLADHYAIDRTTKVAVTTTTTNGRVILLSSYNRINNDDGSKYQFHRAEKPQREITVWEAARATSAAPRIFKPFDHEQTGQSYLDGAIYYNCPIEVAMRERRLIWPDVADANPDVVLSIGTSYNRKSPKKSSINSNNSRWGIVTHFRQLAKIAIDHVQSTLNSEQTWQDFVQSMSLTDQVKERFIRLNLPLEQDPPRLDEVSAMIELQNMTSSHWVLRRNEIKSIADRLLATAFYFEKSPDVAIECEDHSFCITGSIVCRFSPGSEEIRALGEAFRKRSLDAYDRADTDHNPYFVVSQRRKEKEARQVIIRPHIVDKMIRDAHFSVGKTTLTLSDKMAESDISLCFGDQPTNPTFYPISGFPRRLFEEDRRTFGRSRPSLSLIRKRTPTQFNRGPWTRPSDDAPDRQVDLIKNYEAPNYLYPGGATSDVISEISHRFSSPSPGAPDAVSYGATLSLYDIARSESFTSGHSDNLFTLSRSGSPLPPPGVFEMSADLPERGRLSPRPPLGNKQNARYEML